MNSDEQARQRIINDLETTFLVEAGAGSGKTTSLIARMEALIRTGKADISHISAITFTRKAASELRSRFQMALEKALLEKGLTEEEHTRLEEGLQNINLCYIGTIHSFCGRLLRERPLEAQIDPGFREIEEDEDAEFADACWDDYLVLLQTEGHTSEWDALKAMGLDVSDLRAVYHKVSGYPDIHIVVDQVPRPDFDVIRDSLLTFVQEAKRWIPHTEPEKGWDNLQQAVLQTERRIKFLDLNQDAVLVQLIESLYEKKLSVVQNRWTDKNAAKALQEEMVTWQQTVMNPVLRQWREYRHPYVIRFVQPAVEYCAKRRKDAGLLNFQDLLMKAAALLRESEEVREYFKGRYLRLFVDEFQDTDPIQAEIMFLLTGHDTRVTDWRKAEPTPGSLFVVGDPKQSIYRFRRADMVTYNFVKQRIEETRGEILELTANFRSVRAIGSFVDEQFKDYFLPEATVQQARFVPLATRRVNPETDYGVYRLNYPSSLSNKEAVIEADAERIARWIRWACDGHMQIYEFGKNGEVTGSHPAGPGDFMILTYNRAPMHEYGHRLELYGVPSIVVDSQQTYLELHELAMLVQCLANPTDKIALVATLRSVFFGISDNSLYHYKREGYTLSLFHLPDSDEVTEDSRPILLALEKLRDFYRIVQSLPALAAFERILSETGYLVFTAVQPGGMGRAGMITTLLQLLNSEPESAVSWSSLARTIADLDARGIFPSSSLYPGRSDAVIIMNLHKAKGLEAPIVFLAAPCGYSEHDADTHVDRTHDEANGYFIVEKSIGSSAQFAQRKILAQPTQWDKYADLEAESLRAERHRLLYVAATRAMQMLVIGQWEGKAMKDPWSAFSQALEHVDDLADVDVDQPVQEEWHEQGDMSGFVEKQRARIEQLERPTFTRTSVTAEVKTEGTALERRGMGLGPAFGTVVHRCLDAFGKGVDEKRLPALVKVISEEEGLAADHHDEAIRTVRGVFGSEFWKRSLEGSRRLQEVPFIVNSSGNKILGQALSEVAIDGDDVTQITYGVIDLAFEESDGWVIVDFKTDAFDMDQEGDFVSHYSGQVNRYRQVWSEVFGYSVKEAGLYFTNRQRYVVVEKGDGVKPGFGMS